MDITQRRARLVTRHHLAGTGVDLVAAVRDLVALHASDPATVYLSLLARVPSASLASIRSTMYDDRALVRLMGMRRTLFVVPLEFAPTVHHAAAVDVATTMRKQLLKQLASLPTEPAVTGEVEAWLAEVEAGVERAIDKRGSALANQLSADEPRLRTAFLPTTDKGYDVRRAITSQVLTMMATEGRLVRASPRGTWISRQHAWESARRWWPDGFPAAPDARADLVRAYLARFGPATELDIKWWTGWTLGHTRKAVADLGAVDLGAGYVLPDDVDPVVVPAPSASLLPALDPTPMGWKEREWFLPAEDTAWRQLYDRNGNIGPTIWWDGEIVGGWSVRPDGSIATRILVDRGTAARDGVHACAAALEPRLEGTPVIPAFPTPLDKELRSG